MGFCGANHPVHPSGIKYIKKDVFKTHRGLAVSYEVKNRVILQARLAMESEDPMAGRLHLFGVNHINWSASVLLQ